MNVFRKPTTTDTSRVARTELQLEGFWLHLARGAWIGFLLVELLYSQADCTNQNPKELGSSTPPSSSLLCE
jgi:hypothetical protein